jgi:hypothetical protein
MVVNGACTIAVCIVQGGVARFGTLLALRATNTVANLVLNHIKTHCGEFYTRLGIRQ